MTICGLQTTLTGNLYKIWNRMSSGTYFPDPIKRSAYPFCQRLMTQSPCIVFSHTGGKSLNTCTDNKKFDLLMN